MAEIIPSINLLPKKSGGFIAQFFEWALAIGRLLIILTETLALATFLYRFSLDMRIVDLNDKIKVETLIVKNFSKSEEAFRNLQDKLALAKEYGTTSANAPILFNDIAELGRGRITFRELLVSTDSVKIEAEARSSAPLSLFVNDLKKHPAIESVTIEKVDNNTSSARIIVSINASIRGGRL